MILYNFSATKEIISSGTGKCRRTLLPPQNHSAFCSCSLISVGCGLQNEKEVGRIVSFQYLQEDFFQSVKHTDTSLDILICKLSLCFMSWHNL